MRKSKRSVTVFAPASSANLGSGFDVFGLAVAGPGDYLRMERTASSLIRIRQITGDGGRLSMDPENNTAGVALGAYLRALGEQAGFDIWLKKKLPLGSGLGSSAASAVAAVFAANELLGRPMDKHALVRWAAEGERVASGAVHADNIAPSMLGGITLVRSLDPLDVVQMPVPTRMLLVIAHPHVEVKTSDARKVLPRNIALPVAIRQWSNTAALVAACYEDDLALFARSMEDLVAEPARKALIPFYNEAKSASLQAGALACSISGAGPSILSVAGHPEKVKKIAAAIRKVFRAGNLGCDIYITRVDRKGARVINL